VQHDVTEMFLGIFPETLKPALA